MININTVYVVDDDPSSRKGIARLVRTASYDVSDFASANEFLEALGPDAQGCVILDAGITGLSTEENHADLKLAAARLPIIVVSAHDDPDTRQKAKTIGAVGFFRKPVDGTALLDAIDWALRSSSSKENEFSS
jgi:FixJ family two-component response regulator